MELKDLLTECKQLDKSLTYKNNPSDAYLETFPEKKLVAILIFSHLTNQNRVFKINVSNYFKKKYALKYFRSIEELCKILVKDNISITKTAMLKHLPPSVVNAIRPIKSINNKIEPVSLTNDLEATLFDARYKDNSLSTKDFKILLNISPYKVFICNSVKMSDIIYRKAKKNKTTLIELVLCVRFIKDSLFYKEVSWIHNGNTIEKSVNLISANLQNTICIYTSSIKESPKDLHTLILLYIKTKNNKHAQELHKLIQLHPDFTQENTSNLRKLSKLFTKD